MSTKEDREKIRKKTIEEEEKDDCFVCHNCKIGMCKVGMKR